MSSANNLGFDAKFPDKSLIWIKNNSGPRSEPWETPASTLAHKEYWSFNMALCVLLFKKYANEFKSLPDMPFRLIL